MKQRPPGVPKLAKWTPARHWTYTNPRTRAGRWWDERGRVICEWTEDKLGKVHGTMRSYHPGGELAAETPYVRGEPRGTERLFAPTRGKATPFFPAVGVAVRRIERVWQGRTKIASTVYYDAGGRRCDELGRPLRAKRDTRATAAALAKRFRRTKSETFEQALERSQRWTAAFVEAGHGDALREAFERFFANRKDHAVYAAGRPAGKTTIARISRAIGRLPASYARFLRTVGSIELLDGWETLRPADVVRVSKHVAAMIETMRRDAGQTKKMRPQRWLVIARQGEELFAFALDLDGSPIVHLYLDDGPEYGVVGDFDHWMSSAVDRVFAEVAHALG